LPTLRQLESIKITHNPPANQQQKLEKLLAACDSELERTVLQKIADEGLPLPDEAQHIIYDKDVRIAKPDFYYKQQSIALFVDGPAHDQDYTKRDDEEKRKKIRALGYRVFTITYSDIEQGIATLRQGLE
jgi:very-short-patch-repair endonuclease